MWGIFCSRRERANDLRLELVRAGDAGAPDPVVFDAVPDPRAAGAAGADPRVPPGPRRRPGPDRPADPRPADQLAPSRRPGRAQRCPADTRSARLHRQPPGRVLLEFCRDREGDVLRFTTDIRVWPTDNISERGLRPVKTQQKISGRLTSEETTQDRLDICGSSTPSASTEPTSWLASATLSPVSCGGHRFPRRPDRRTSPTPTDLANPAGSRSPPRAGTSWLRGGSRLRQIDVPTPTGGCVRSMPGVGRLGG
jgi:hypothetical protein